MDKPSNRKRGTPLDKYVLEALCVRDGIHQNQIDEKTGLSKRVIGRAFSEENVDEEPTIKSLAALFHVDPEALKSSVISPLDAGETVVAAYELMAKHFLLPEGYFANLPIEKDIMAAAREWQESAFEELNLTDREYARLFVLLNQRYVIRSSDNRYERMRRYSGDGDLYIYLLGKLTTTMISYAKEVEDLEIAKPTQARKKQILWTFQRHRDQINTIGYSRAKDYFYIQRDIITAFFVYHPHVHAWALECWNHISPSLDNFRLNEEWDHVDWNSGDKSIIGKLEIALGNLHEMFTTAHKIQPSKLIESLDKYFDALRMIVRIWDK